MTAGVCPFDACRRQMILTADMKILVQALLKLLTLPLPIYLLRMCSIISDVTASVNTCHVSTSSPGAGDISELVSFI